MTKLFKIIATVVAVILLAIIVVVLTIRPNSQPEPETTTTPDYSPSKLAELLDQNRAKIEKLYVNTYPDVLGQDYDINQIQLQAQGQWASVVLTEKLYDDNNYTSTFYSVAQLVDGSWQVAAAPQSVLTVYNSADVPRDILVKTNQITPQTRE